VDRDGFLCCSRILLPVDVDPGEVQEKEELGKSVNRFFFTMTAYLSQTQMTLGQMYTALWDSNHGRM
jgi:hypothetical protein